MGILEFIVTILISVILLVYLAPVIYNLSIKENLDPLLALFFSAIFVVLMIFIIIYGIKQQFF